MHLTAEIYLVTNQYLKASYSLSSLIGGISPTLLPMVIEREGLDYICLTDEELAFVQFLEFIAHVCVLEAPPLLVLVSLPIIVEAINNIMRMPLDPGIILFAWALASGSITYCEALGTP